MATSAKVITNKRDEIQSKAQKILNEQKEKVASTTEATKSGSTETPVVTETPKVTQMAKAMPSITIPEIKPVEINTQANTTVPVDVRSDVKDLFAKKTTPTLKKADTNLLSKDDSAVTPLDLVKASIKAGGQVEKEVDKITQSKVEDWLNSKWEENRKLREENTQSLFDFGGKTREATKEAFYSAEERINDTEYTIVKVSDIINEKMGGMGFLVNPMDLFLKGALGRDKSYTESFQEKQGWYWDTYAKESEIEAQQAYDKDETSQQITQDVSDFFYDITGNQEVSNMLGNVAGHTISTLKDPNQVAHVVGYMAPALLTAWAGGGGFLLNTSVWIPSQTTNVYKDFAEDPELSSQFTDDQLFGMSLGIGTLLSMVETFGDALGDMPWAKSMSRTIRQNFSRLISSNIKKGLSKEITDMVDISLVKDVKQPVLNALKKWFMGSIGEGVEEVTQDTIQTESARALGSKREGMTLENALTTFFVAQGMGLGIGGIGGGLNIKNNYDLKEEYKNFSNAVDDLAPGINEDTKMAFFSAIKTSQQKDADLSERTIARYEAQTTKLYEKRSMLEQRLKQSDNDEVRAKINGMIEQTDKKIKEIYKKINQWNNTRDEINKYIEEHNAKVEEEEMQKELEESPAEVNQSIEGENLQEQDMENLSEQTMRDLGDQKDTPEFKKWFEGSKIVDKKGNPRVVYHGTKQDFNVFRRGELGFHFGSTKTQAKARAGKGGKIMELYLNMKNPIYVDADLGNWTANYRIGDWLRDKGIISEDELRMFKNKEDATSDKILRSLLKEKGYDGIIYDNIWEGNGKRKSYIVFEPTQIKSATDNIGTFDETNPDIRYGSIKTLQKAPLTWYDKKALREDFEESVKQIKEGKDYSDTKFADYAYANTATMIKDREDVDKVISKVYDLLQNIGVSLIWITNPEQELGHGFVGLYESDKKRVTYTRGYNDVPIYGHEVFHAIMDVVYNGQLTDSKLQAQLQEAFDKEIERIKKQFGIDKYKKGTYEYKWANTFAEEWLANSFGEFLAKREIVGPKSFVEEVIAFFKDIIDLLFNDKQLTEQSLSRQLRESFEAIANGEVIKKRNTFYSRSLSGLRLGGKSSNPIESSTEFTQEELKNMDGYAESQEENETQSKQQDELGEHRKEIVEDGKQSDYENEIYNDAMDVELSQDVVDGKVSTTPQTIRDVFGKDKKKRKSALSIMKTEAVQGYHNVMTSAKTRIFNISPRIAGRLVQMETQRDIYIHRFREKAKPFVKAISKLDDKAKLEIKKALLDYGALASEQGENIEQYKQEEVAKLKEVLNKYGISEEATNDMFAMLNELGQRYKDAGLKITLSDIYFPRTVTDYEGLQDYIAEQTGIPQEDKATLLSRIQKITRDTKLTDEEKEQKIRHWMTTDYREPGKKSKNAKERKMGLLSEWGEGIYQFYGDPIEALDNYIVTMEDAIQKQLFLGGLQEDAGLKDENVSLEEIIEGLVDEGKISNEDLEELKKSVSAVLNKKPTPKIVKTAKSIIHIGLLANFMSAITQFDDLGVVILRDKSGLKNIVKALFGKAGIKYTDLGLENSYEIFKDQMNITNWFFARSLFNAVDRLGKTSFINTAWESLKRQAKKNKDGTDTKSRKILIKRLTDMYGADTANHIMEKIDSNNYMTDGQIDIDVLTDLLYLLSDTQPIYTSDMPTAYLNGGWVRLCYSLQSFTIKRINMLIQGAIQVYKNNGGGAEGAVRAGVWLMYTTAFLAMWGAMIGDAQDWLKGKKDETTLYKLITEGIDAALDQLWGDAKGSWLKMWNLSDYDKKIYKRQGAWGWLMSKFEPPIIGMGADLLEAIKEHNKDEITDLAKYTPIIGKLLYYWFWDELGKETKGKEDGWDWGEEKKWDWGDKKEYNR